MEVSAVRRHTQIQFGCGSPLISPVLHRKVLSGGKTNQALNGKYLDALAVVSKQKKNGDMLFSANVSQCKIVTLIVFVFGQKRRLNALDLNVVLESVSWEQLFAPITHIYCIWIE